MSKPVKKVVVVGGGAAGWITAGLIAAEHDAHLDTGIDVVLIESPDVATIGVGEGTWPTMRTTLSKLRIGETDFIRDCDASFKQGTRFDRWHTGASNDVYYHPFTLPHGYKKTNLAASWLSLRDRVSFADAVGVQSHLCARGLAPKQGATPEYASVANYGYHLDAGKFAALLQKHCTKLLGVEHILDHVTAVNADADGDIVSVSSKQHGDLNGDLFIDCTGFASLLLGQHYEIPFVSRKDTLFVDTALAVQVPYADDNSPIASQTISTAQTSGWIWDIGLSSRRGVGHVYSSAHVTDEQAEEELRAYLRPAMGDDAESASLRKISINPGHRQKFWHRNCVAVGMAAGFLEPLEASALVLVELSAQMISEQLPATRETMTTVARRFNDKFLYRWDGVIDFLKLHYVLTERTDTEFWVDNCRTESVPDSLQELLTLWRHHVPWHGDFTQADEVFSSASYQFVLYGMGFRTEPPASTRRSVNAKEAARLFQENAEKTRKLLAGLPTNRELINQIKEFGLPKGKVA
jgi:2-polyprenyl-6-methoxyphenol hydroxylase-like FAD-dependent oxidoreductase